MKLEDLRGKRLYKALTIYVITNDQPGYARSWIDSLLENRQTLSYLKGGASCERNTCQRSKLGFFLPGMPATYGKAPGDRNCDYRENRGA